MVNPVSIVFPYCFFEIDKSPSFVRFEMFLSSEGGSEYWEVVRGELSQSCPLCRVSNCSREDCKFWESRLLSLLVSWGENSGWVVIVYYCMV